MSKKPSKCPKCGSKDIRESYASDTLKVTGEIVGHVVGGAIGGLFNFHNLGIGVGHALGESAQEVYNRMVCKHCGHTWEPK